MSERTAPGAGWAAPGADSGSLGAPPAPALATAGSPEPDAGTAGTAGTAGLLPDGASRSTGVAVARGDAPRPRRASVTARDVAGLRIGDRTRTADDPAAALEGNPLRGLGVAGAGAVLDSSFDLLRFRFRRFVALAAVLFVPVQLFDLWIALSAGTTTSVDSSSQFQLFDTGAGPVGWAYLLLALEACALFLLGMAAGHLVQGWLDGRDDPFGTVVGAVARRAWVVPIVVVVAVVAKSAAACAGGVGFFLVDALFFVAGPVAGAERTGPFATIGRSVRLGRGSYGTALAVCFGGFAITIVLRIALALGPLALVAMLGLPEGWLVVLDQASSLTLLVTMPLTACIAARAYVDLRCRVEGYDLVRREVARGLVP